MMQIKIDNMGLLKTLASATELNRAIQYGITEGWYNFGDYLVRKAKDAIEKDAKTGRIYKLYGQLAVRAGKVMHQASAPGESPANLTGDLARGIHHQLTGDGLTWGYSASTPYGKELEFGAKGPGKRKLLKRPNIMPISKKSDVTAAIIFNESIQSEFLKAF